MSGRTRDLTGLGEDGRVKMEGVYDWIEHDLTDEDRDAVITHPDPTHNCSNWKDPAGCGCLVGQVMLRRTAGRSYAPFLLGSEFAFDSPREESRAYTVGCDAALLAIDLGPEEFWRRVKRFAAAVSGTPGTAPPRVNEAPAPEPVPEEVAP